MQSKLVKKKHTQKNTTLVYYTKNNFNIQACIKKENVTQAFSCEFREIFNDHFFKEYLR